MDNWDRKTNFNCDSCMFYVPKLEQNPDSNREMGRCRRNAPTLKGFPVVFSSDWCGEHKIGSNPVRDGKEEPQHPFQAFCDECNSLWENLGGTILGTVVEIKKCPSCEEKARIKKEIEVKIAGIIWHCEHTTGEYPIERDLIKAQACDIHHLLEKL